MKSLLKERFRERALDARDWFEIRPDPHWWPVVAIPGVVGLAYVTVPHGFFPILLLGAAILTVALIVLGVLGGVCFLVGRVVGDVLKVERPKETPKPAINGYGRQASSVS